MSKIAILPGTFDPPTLGHLDLIQRAAKACDHLIIAIATKPNKKPLFTSEERKEMIHLIAPKVEVIAFNGLIVDLAREKKAAFLIRGLRSFSDFDYEFQMALANRKLGSIETLFLPAEHTEISSTLIREIAHFGGPLHDFVPPVIEAMIRKKFTP